MHRDAGRKDDLAGRQDRSDAENRVDLGLRDRLAADAWAGQDVGHSGDHLKATDHDCLSALVRDFQSEAGRDCPWAKDVAVECPAEPVTLRQGAVH